MEYDDEEEQNIIDLAKDILKIWPLSLLFPEKVKVSHDNVDKKKKVDEESIIEIPEPKIIGHNIDRGIDQGLGSLHFVIKYEVLPQTLKIILFQGKNLVGKDPRGTSDPYGVISFDPKFRDDEIYKTEVKKKTLNPIWNHVFVFLNFTHSDLDRYRICITVYDWDTYRDHEPLGEVYYNLIKLHGKDHAIDSVKDENESVLYNNSVKSDVKDWLDKANTKFPIEEPKVPLMPITEEDLLTVERSASMIFNNNVNYDEMEEEDEEIEYLYHQDDDDDDDDSEGNDEMDEDHEKSHRAESNEENGTINIIRRIEIWKNLQALPNSRSAYGEILISLDYSIRTRQLIVQIIKAKNMIDPSKRSLIPYCTLRHLFISNDREKTKSIHHTSYRFYSDSPVWNEEFPLKVAPDKLKQTAVEIQVFHSTKESKVKDEELGLIRLGLKTYPSQKAHYVEFLANIGKPIAHWHLIRT